MTLEREIWCRECNSRASRLERHAVGGILAAPVRDTLKRCDGDGSIVETVDRNAMWQAMTPQMFRLGMLRSAIERALADGIVVTDEDHPRAPLPTAVPTSDFESEHERRRDRDRSGKT